MTSTVEGTIPSSEMLQPSASVIQDIPDEIWCAVFANFTQENGWDRIKVSLAEVCRPWRRAILTNPNFWTNITIVDKSEERTAEFFSRAGDTIPLNIIIRSRLGSKPERGESSWSESVTEMSFDWIVQYTARILTLEIRDCIPLNFPWFASFPILRDLRLHGVGEFYKEMSFPENGHLFPSNLVRKVTLTKMTNPLGFPILWKGLSSLIIEYTIHCPYRPLINILEVTAPTLQTFKLSILKVGDGWPPDFSLTLPKLTSLQLIVGPIFRLLNSLTTPSLQSISLGRVRPDIWAEAVSGLVQRSSCTLREVGIRDLHPVYYEGYRDYPQTRDVIGSMIEILMHFPSVLTIRTTTHSSSRRISELLAAIDSPLFWAGSPLHTKAIFWRQIEDDPAAGKSVSTATQLVKNPAVVLARAIKMTERLPSVGEYEDVHSVFSEANIEGLQRVDIYI